MHSGDMVVRMLKDTDSLVALFVTTLPSALIALAQLVGALCLLYYFSPPLALILGVGMPFLAVFAKFYYKRMRQNMLLFVLLRMKVNMVLMRTSFLHCIVQQVITLPFLTKMISGREIR